MTTWILIIAFYKGGVAQIEYTNEEKCVAAIEEVSLKVSNFVQVFCVKKD